MAIRWKMPFDVAERAYYLQQQLDNSEITQEMFAEELAMLPGYPLTRLLQGGDDLRMEVQPKPIVSGKAKSKVIH